MRRIHRVGLVAIAAVTLIFGQTACTGGVGPTGPQATGQAEQVSPTSSDSPDGTTPAGDGTLSGACLEISEAMSQASTEMGSAIQDGLTDPEGVKEAMLVQAEALKNAVNVTTNPEVKVALQAVADDMSAFADVFQGLPDLANPSAWANDPVALEKVTQLGGKLQTAGEDLNASLGELLTLCNYTP